jgi:hypothetical protein
MNREMQIRKNDAGAASRSCISLWRVLCGFAALLFLFSTPTQLMAGCGSVSKSFQFIQLNAGEQMRFDAATASFTQPNHSDPNLPCRIPICKSQRDKNSPAPVETAVIAESIKFLIHVDASFQPLTNDLSNVIPVIALESCRGFRLVLDRPPISV